VNAHSHSAVLRRILTVHLLSVHMRASPRARKTLWASLLLSNWIRWTHPTLLRYRWRCWHVTRVFIGPYLKAQGAARGGGEGGGSWGWWSALVFSLFGPFPLDSVTRPTQPDPHMPRLFAPNLPLAHALTEILTQHRPTHTPNGTHSHQLSCPPVGIRCSARQQLRRSRQ
jgi:hypothetical protein